MERMERMKTLEVLPRYLCLSVEEGGDRYCFSPVTEIRGNALRRSPRVLRRMFEETAAYKKHEATKPSYIPKFPWPEELLSEEPAAIPNIVREGVKKKEGTYVLFDAEPGEAIREIVLRGNVLEGEIKSTSGRGRYTTIIRNAFVDRMGNPQITAIACGCGDHVFVLEKGGKEVRHFIIDLHNHTNLSELWDRMYNPHWAKKQMKKEGETPTAPVLSPFSFTPNWSYKNGIYRPKDIHLGALEGDVLMAYYAICGEDDDLFGINERLFTIHESYSPSSLNWIRSGKAKRRVIGQRRKVGDVNIWEQKEEKRISKDFDKALRQRGYDYDGMCRELGSRIAHRYVNQETGTAVNVVFSANEPPFYTVREPIGRSMINPTGEYVGEKNPFKLIGRRNLRAFDDVTMRDTKLKVEVPTAFRIPGSDMIDTMPSKRMRRLIRNEIRKAHGGEVTGTEKYARVHYAD